MARPFFKDQLRAGLLRVLLVTVNVIVLLLCLAVFVTGLWARFFEGSYAAITGDPNLTRTSISVAVVGLCASLLALLGIVGAFLLKSILGRVVLSVYAFVLLFVIVAEVATGVAAIKSRDDLLSKITDSTVHSLNTTYHDTVNNNNTGNTSSSANTWDKFQRKYMCCGAQNYSDFFPIFPQDEVPRSCCTHAAKKNGQCPDPFKAISTPDDIDDIYTRPCLDVVAPKLREAMLVLAVVAIAIGISQSSGIVFSALMIYVTVRREGKMQSYQKLKRRTRSSSYYST